MFKFESAIVTLLQAFGDSASISFASLPLFKVLKLLRFDLNITMKESRLFPFFPPPLFCLNNHDVHIGGWKILLKTPFFQLHLPFSFTTDESQCIYISTKELE
jgi:hypothetical protein